MKLDNLEINNIRDVENIEKVPLEDRLKERTTYDIIKAAAKQWPSRDALIFLPPSAPLDEPVIFTYQQLFDVVKQTANLLVDLGVKSGDVVSYILPNIPENYFLFLSAQAVGIANPINPSLPPEQIAELLRTADSEILITTGSKTNPKLWNNIQAALNIYCGIKRIIVLEDSADAEKNVFNFYELLRLQPIEPMFNEKEIKSKAICSYFHTSGTMGPPKLVQHTHWGKVHIAWATGIFAKYERKNAVILSGLPMFHVGAPIVVALSAFLYGASVVVMSPLGWSDPLIISHFWKIVEKYHGTSVVAVPPIYKALLKVPLNGADVSSLYSAISGNVAISEEDSNQFHSITGVRISTIWGQSEAILGCFNYASLPNSKNFGAAGIRLPYEQIKIVKLDIHGNILRECLPMERGLLCIRGSNITGYRSQELNQDAFFQSNWFNTGDWAYQNSEGYVWILGRQADFINYRDLEISLLEIETILHQHPMITKAAAISIPDQTADVEVLRVYVTLQQEAKITVDELKLYIQKSLREELKFIPIDIEICNSLPLNGMGKVLKYILKEEATRAQGSGEILAVR